MAPKRVVRIKVYFPGLKDEAIGANSSASSGLPGGFQNVSRRDGGLDAADIDRRSLFAFLAPAREKGRRVPDREISCPQ
jgi:hypothetical protein